mgnify:CR=1 FL=1
MIASSMDKKILGISKNLIKKKTGNLFLYSSAVFVVIVCIFPFLWAIISSFKKGADLFTTSLIPQKIAWENYTGLFQEQPFGINILNSICVACSTVLLSLALSVLAAYAFGRCRFRGRETLLFSILSISMFPQVAVLSGMFELVQSLGLYNKVFSLVFVYMIFTLPFTIWVLTTFMKDLPREIEEAAILEGASKFTICFKIFLPLLKPAMVTTGLLAFIAAWNEFLFALTFTLSSSERTVPVAIALMSGADQHELPWGNIMAASVLVTLPLIGLVLLFQRKIVAGLTAGAIKG